MMKKVYVVGEWHRKYNSVVLQTKMLAEKILDIFHTPVIFIEKEQAEKYAGNEDCIVIYPYGSFRMDLHKVKNFSNIIFIYHNITPAKYFLTSEPLVAMRALAGRVQLRHLCNKGIAWVAVSRYNGEELERYGRKEILFCPNIIDNPITFLPEKTEIPSVLYVGRIVQNKNCLKLCSVVAEVAKKMGNRIRFSVVGTGKKRSSYFKKFCREIERMSGFVEINWIDSIDETELKRLYQESWLYISTSLHEGFGLPACESIINGTPAVYTRSGGQESVLNNCGLVSGYHEMVELISDMFSDKSRYNNLLKEQLAQVMPYTKDKVGLIIEEVFKPFLID